MAIIEDGFFGSLPEQAAPERVGSGRPRLRYAERDQMIWRPVSLDALLAEDHRVRLVWRFVEGLDLGALRTTIKSVDGRPGHPPADPRILLALWLYATVEGVGSAREVARLCEEHIAFQWLCGGVGMNAKTLADFRVDHLFPGYAVHTVPPAMEFHAALDGWCPDKHVVFRFSSLS